ncbi:MAG: 16S rRNA (guanine527-N7)-methyltransferase [Saprospiraceae bacterium]|jgi:16S rRNA (guanine527-N7)-methyltransferase
METISKYFPKLSALQIQQLAQLPSLYLEWNDKINVISRKDIDNIVERHILHSLAIAKVITFLPGAEVLDLGTGGGFPGIPLAILFPETQFTLIDGTGKKIMVTNEVINALELKNVKAKHMRSEEIKHHFDFVVCRAVASLDKLIDWSFRLLKKKQTHAIPNGLITLKGGDIKAEIRALSNKQYIETYPVSKYFAGDFFEEKYVVYVQG